MAELIPRDRLQPSLLDRLADDEPQQRQESREKRMLSPRALRQAVLRDLAWLMNATGIDAFQDLAACPLAARSVVNYGMHDLTGRTASGLDAAELEQWMRTAIANFEPRILHGTLVVRAMLPGTGAGVHNRLVFEIEGELWGQRVPERLLVKTELDLETGEVTLSDFGAAGA